MDVEFPCPLGQGKGVRGKDSPSRARFLRGKAASQASGACAPSCGPARKRCFPAGRGEARKRVPAKPGAVKESGPLWFSSTGFPLSPIGAWAKPAQAKPAAPPHRTPAPLPSFQPKPPKKKAPEILFGSPGLSSHSERQTRIGQGFCRDCRPLSPAEDLCWDSDQGADGPADHSAD